MLEKKQSGKLLAAEETRAALLKLRRERGVWREQGEIEMC